MLKNSTINVSNVTPATNLTGQIPNMLNEVTVQKNARKGGDNECSDVDEGNSGGPV